MRLYLIDARLRLAGRGGVALILASLLWLTALPMAANGQQIDSLSAGTAGSIYSAYSADSTYSMDSTADSIVVNASPVRVSSGLTSAPPISPKRAFFTSLLLPGYAQARLDRQTSSMIYAVFEIVSIGMLTKSAQDLRSAKRLRADSVIVGYQPGSSGEMLPVYGESRINAERIKARKLHYEDWIAAIAFNHLISAADAYVAAYLWDFRANLEVQSGAAGARTARVGLSRSF